LHWLLDRGGEEECIYIYMHACLCVTQCEVKKAVLLIETETEGQQKAEKTKKQRANLRIAEL